MSVSPAPDTATISVLDARSGQRIPVVVPAAHAHTWIGWGDAARVAHAQPDGSTRHGLLVSLVPGHGQALYLDEDGVEHSASLGRCRIYRPGRVSAEPEEADDGQGGVLAKRGPEPRAPVARAGERWITAHPNGEGSKGVPILIQEHPDGTARVIGGAGGKLTHLILHNVKSKEEHAAAAAQRAKERRDQERERQATLSEGEKRGELDHAKDVGKLRRQEERSLVERVREKLGGVRPDLVEEDRKRMVEQGLSEGQIKAVELAHHRAQYKEAVERSRAALKMLAERQGEGASVPHKAVEAATSDDTEVSAKARELATMALDAEEDTREALGAMRQEQRERLVGGDPRINERAAAAALTAIEAAPSRDEERQQLQEKKPEQRTATEEMRLRALEHEERARTLARLAQGSMPEGDEERAAAEQALKSAGIADGLEGLDAADETMRAKLEAAAGKAWRRAEVDHARTETLQHYTEQDGEQRARAMLNTIDVIAQSARDRTEARKLGLHDKDPTGLRDADLQEMMEVAKDFARHQAARKELAELARETDPAERDHARRAFELKVGAELSPEEHAALEAKVRDDLEEHGRQQVTRRLLGAASAGNADYQTAVGAGHYDGFADVAHGIAGERLLDRVVVDALGPRHAALLLRHALESAGHDPEALLEAVEGHHVQQVTEASHAALDRAAKVAPQLQATLAEAGDFERAAAQLKMHQGDVRSVQQTIGSAIGRLEATAALGQALREPLPTEISLDAKRAGLDTTLAWLHAAGLGEGDYQIIKDVGVSRVVIPQSSWSKMLTRESPEEVADKAEIAAIKRGERDQEGWLPAGIIRREASTFTAPVPEARRLREEMRLPQTDDVEELKAAIERHAGSRLAEGEHPADVMADLTSLTAKKKAANEDAYVQAVKEVFPVLDEEGRRIKAQDLRDHYQGIADRFMAEKYGSTDGSFHAQDIRPESEATREAVFRTLAKQPEAQIAFKPLGSLTPADQRELRDLYNRRMGIDPKLGYHPGKYQELLKVLGEEPKTQQRSMFGGGGGGPSPAQRRWRLERDLIEGVKTGAMSATEATRQLNAEQEKSPVDHHDDFVRALRSFAAYSRKGWTSFVEDHGSRLNAYRALQDEMKSGFLRAYQTEHGKVTGEALRGGVTDVHNREAHEVAMLSPEEAAERRAERQARMAQMAKRDEQGRLAERGGEGSDKLRHQEAERREAAASEAQIGFGFAKVQKARTDPQVGERFTLGERAENQIASLVNNLGKPFEPGKPIGLFPGLNMDGPRATQQRVIRAVERVKRLGGFLGTGSGKSLTSIGTFTHLHDKGLTQHGLYLVPSAVQDQFGGEMLRYTEPGRYNWETGSGKSHAERVAMLKDPSIHMRVMTHQSYRDTALRVMADHHGLSMDGIKARLAGETPEQRAKTMRAAFDAQGIPQHYVYYDEAHTAEARDEDPSATHLVRSATTHPINATHYLHGTATPVKNDTGELWSVAAALRPDKYGDRVSFLQNFGQATAAANTALRRELAHQTYTARIDPEGVDRRDTDNPTIIDGRKVGGTGPLKLEPAHQALVDEVDAAYQRARKARRAGRVDIEALQRLSPGAFRDKPPEEHEAIAGRLTDSLGVVKETALRRAVNGAPPAINTKLKAMTEVIKHDLAQNWTDKKGKARKGKAPVVFTDRASEARMIHQHLLDQGIRSALYHGGLTAEERDKVRLGFQPEDGSQPLYDVVVATASAEAGVNMQRASVIHNFDVPVTDKSWAQRAGRAFRQGQLGDVDIHDWHSDAEFDQAARRRLMDKRDLASVLQDPITHLDEHGIAGHYRRVLEERHANVVEPGAAVPSPDFESPRLFPTGRLLRPADRSLQPSDRKAA